MVRSPFGPEGDTRELLPGISVHFMVKDPPIDRMAMLVAYLSPFVDEFVIVDTGSQPGVVNKMLGWNHVAFPDVRVIEEPFVDFSTTRNKGLVEHRYEWTIGIDPDELPSLMMMMHMAKAAGPEGKEKTPDARGWLYWTINWWDGVLGPAHDYHWHTRLWKTKGSYLYRPVHELVMVQGVDEASIRNSVKLPKAPVEAYLIHSKGGKEIEEADKFYANLGEVSR